MIKHEIKINFNLEVLFSEVGNFIFKIPSILIIQRYRIPEEFFFEGPVYSFSLDC